MIKLGSEVKDVLTGFSGIAIQRLEQINGNVQIGIQPPMKEGSTEYPDSLFIDHHMLEVIGAGHSDRVTEPAEATEDDVQLGQEVRDMTSGFTGIAVQRVTYMNGCISFAVQPAVRLSGEAENVLQDSIWIGAVRLEVVDDGVADIVKPVKKSSNGKVPGGPTQKCAPSRCC